MDNDWEERVRIRAYEIWEREGCPEGGASNVGSEQRRNF